MNAWTCWEARFLTAFCNADSKPHVRVFALPVIVLLLLCTLDTLMLYSDVNSHTQASSPGPMLHCATLASIDVSPSVACVCLLY